MTMTGNNPAAAHFARLTADFEDAAAIAAEGQAATRTRDETRDLCRRLGALLRAAGNRLDRIGDLVRDDGAPHP